MNLSNLCAEFSKCTSPESKLEIVNKMILLQDVICRGWFLPPNTIT